MSKAFYIFILLFLSSNYLDFIPITGLTSDVILFISWLWGIYGFTAYTRFRNNPLNIFRNRRYVYLFLIIMFSSVLYPLITYDQSIISTLIAQRENYGIFFLVLFLYMHPCEMDFIKALGACSYLSISIMLLSIIFPTIFLSTESFEYLKIRQANGSTDLITATPGFRLLFFYFLIKGSMLLQRVNFKHLIEFVFLMLMIFLVQNRSTLIIAVPIFIYIFMKLPSKRKIIYWFTGINLIIMSSGYLLQSILNLWDESINQIGDRNYNRWQAFDFFILESDSNLFSVLFGHGISASGSKYLDIMLNAQTERFAYLSDIGIFGAYYLYGVLFVAIIYKFAYRAMRKAMPKYLKFFAIFIFLMPTIQIFGILSSESVVLFSIFFYLIMYFEKYQNSLSFDNNYLTNNCSLDENLAKSGNLSQAK